MSDLEGKNKVYSFCDKWSKKGSMPAVVFTLSELIHTHLTSYKGYTEELSSNKTSKKYISTKLKNINTRFGKEAIYVDYLYDLLSVNNVKARAVKVEQIVNSINSIDKHLKINVLSTNKKDLVMLDETLFAKAVHHLFCCFKLNTKLNLKLHRSKKLSIRLQNANGEPFAQDLIKIIQNYSSSSALTKKSKLNVLIANLCLDVFSELKVGLYYKANTKSIYITIPFAKQMNVFEQKIS